MKREARKEYEALESQCRELQAEVERMRAEKTAYRAMFESPDVLVSAYDRGGVCLVMNEAAAALFGGKPEDFIGKQVHTLHGAAGEAYLRRAQDVIETGEVARFDEHVAFPQGERWLLTAVFPLSDAAGNRYAAQVVAQDITSRIEAEEALRRSEEKYRLLAEYASDVVWAMDLDLSFTYVSPSVERVFGYTQEQAVSNRLEEIMPPESISLLLNHFQGLYAKTPEDATPETLEFEQYRADGSRIWTQVMITPIYGHDGQLSHIQGLTRDITKSKRVEENLRASERRYRTYINHCPAAIFVADGHGHYVDVNQAACRMLGYTRGELLSMSVTDVNLPDSEGRLDRFQELKERGYYRYERVLQRKDGSQVPVDLEAVSLGDGQYMAFCSDISERKQVEMALRENEERFQKMLNVVPDMISIHDPGMNIVYSNWRGFAAVPEEKRVLNTKCYATYRGLDHICPDCRAGQVLTTREPFQEEIELPDGTWVDLRVIPLLDSGGGVELFMEWVRDVTVRKRTEAERERLSLAIEQAAEIVVITGRDGTIQYVNPAFERITGYSREEAIGQTPRILKSGEHDAAFYAALWSTLAAGQVWQGRFINRRKDGALYSEESTISPIFDAQGKVTNYVGVKRDITRELDLEQQYRHAQKMEAIGQLTGGVAHDFNNLLQVINGGTEMALGDLPGGHPAAEILAQVGEAGGRAARLVSQLLAFSRRQIIHPEVLDLNTVVAELLKMLRRVIGEHIHLEWLPGRHLGAVHADRTMMEQVLMNLCVNARDAMPGGGSLTLESQNVRFDSDYCASHAWAEPGRYVLLSVTDTGVGMDEETLEHVFEPFFTTKEEGRGTGLGLATVYGIVRQHDGMVIAYSEPGHGTTFKVYLPICESDADAVGTLIEGPAVGGSETILLAEDDAMVRDLAVRFLENAGYTVLVAEDGRQAMTLFQEHAGQVDMALLDVVMPAMGGREACEKMRAVQPDLPVLFCSGYSENAIHSNFVLKEGLVLLQKPYARAELLRAVRAVLDK